MSCKMCGSDDVLTERRPHGMNTCGACGYKWENYSRNKIVVDCHEERRNKKCLCCVCGRIEKCTPLFDFYTTEDHGEKLVCEKCFYEYLRQRLNNQKGQDDL